MREQSGDFTAIRTRGYSNTQRLIAHCLVNQCPR